MLRRCRAELLVENTGVCPMLIYDGNKPLAHWGYDVVVCKLESLA